MLDIFSGLRLVVKRRNINIDNAIFRCHWFFTSTLLVSFSLIITARQYVGQPIECHSTDKIPDSLLNSYCWVQSTFTVPQACNNQQYGVDVPYPCIDNTRGREIKVYAYYQWVGIVLFVQGLLFHLPYYLWKLWENGLIKAITGGLRVAVLNEQERLKKKDIVVDYIHDHLGCHKRYAFKYFLCEFICLINLFGQLWATNKFFDGQFLRYGLEVMQYSTSTVFHPTSASSSSSSSSSDHSSLIFMQQSSSSSSSSYTSMIQNNNNYSAQLNNNRDNNSNNNLQKLYTSNKQFVDPMTFVFPRMTKCTYFDFGSSGDVQKHDALCLLPLNIINEKIYIALWFWFLILAILTILVIIYRFFAIASESVRCKGLLSRCKLSCERDIRLICKHCDVGDWFLFYMVAENLDPLIMREIVSSIASKINEHLDLKRELMIQLQREETESNERNKITDQHQTQMDADKLARLIAGNNATRLVSQPSSYEPPTPPALKPSAPIWRDSFESMANMFGGGGGGNSRRGSLMEHISNFGKTRRRLYARRQSSAESSQQLSGHRQSLCDDTNVPIGPALSGANAHVCIVGQQDTESAITAAPVGAASATPLLTHRRPSVRPRLKRRGSLNLALLGHSGCETTSLSGASSPSAQHTPTDSCVMEMEPARIGSTSRLDQLGKLLFARRQSVSRPSNSDHSHC